MKRSEMVQTLAESIEKHFDGNNGTWEDTAKKVLADIEKAGLMPPYNFNIFACDDCDKYMWDSEE